MELDKAKNDPALKFWQDNRSPWIHGVAMGDVPGDKEEGAPQPRLVVFTGAAPECELNPIRAAARAADPNARLVTTGAFVGLQGTGVAVGVSAPSRPDVLAVAGTLGAVVEAPGGPYVLGSNHALSFNGRAPDGSLILEPGPVDEESGGSAVAALSHVVPLDPAPSAAPNTADCALAKLLVPKPAGLAAVPLTSAPSLYGKRVRKFGRTTLGTKSTIRLTSCVVPIDFTFGTFNFQGLLGTYDPAAQDPPFARPGDSGALVRLDADQSGIGLVMARAYVFDPQGQVVGTIILICSLAAVAARLARFFPAGSAIAFESTV
jgi:hypothetical protein